MSPKGLAFLYLESNWPRDHLNCKRKNTWEGGTMYPDSLSQKVANGMTLQHRIAISLSLVTAILFFLTLVVTPATAKDNVWESSIVAFEEQDKNTGYTEEAILFIGSSSIRLWQTLAKDMAPYPVINRGFGGATMVDVLHYAKRILASHEPRAIVLFVANDITGKVNDPSVDEAVERFRQFLRQVITQLPDVPAFVVAVTPTESRWQAWPTIRKLNNRLAKQCDKMSDVVFIPTENIFFGSDGRPISQFFRPDQLHLSSEGYACWTKRIRLYLDKRL